jgi:PTH1 family peptidyl-tRNA hydrolase
LVVGLGNPGFRYAATRHNLGFMVVDRVAEKVGAKPWREASQSLVSSAYWQGHHLLRLAKPQTFMNRSGVALRGLLARAQVDLERVVVVHDDLDLPFGRLRIRRTGGHGGHNGLRSLVETIGSGDFVRLKIGIGRPAGLGEVIEYVLGPFSDDEKAELPGIIDRAADAVQCIVVDGPLQAMNQFSA